MGRRESRSVLALRDIEIINIFITQLTVERVNHGCSSFPHILHLSFSLPLRLDFFSKIRIRLELAAISARFRGTDKRSLRL